MNKHLAETAVNKRLGNCHENCQHGNQAKFFRKKQPSQDDRDDKLYPLLAKTLKKAPEESVQCFVF
jgi:hypothetical protein